MTQGRRAGTRRAPKTRQPGVQRSLLLLAVGVTLAVVAWGYLVYAAIDFGSTARGGESSAWWFLALASVGAVACLFVGLMLVSRLLRRLRITGAPGGPARPDPSLEPGQPSLPSAPRPVGGRRAAR